MSATTKSAEQLALQGLLLLIVEAQNIVRDESAEMHEVSERIEQLVESPHARELVQLARGALEAPATVGWNPVSVVPTAPGFYLTTCTNDDGTDPQVHTAHFSINRRKPYWSHNVIAWRERPEACQPPAAIPAAAAGVHA